MSAHTIDIVTEVDIAAVDDRLRRDNNLCPVNGFGHG